MKFLADGMLGKTARWLRIIGYNVKYVHNANDRELIMLAKEENRVLLTKDLQLSKIAQRRDVNTLFIRGKTETEKLSELSQNFNIQLKFNENRSRCPKCNTKLRSIDKKKFKKRIPSSSYQHYELYWICNKCDKVYWKGSHWQEIDKKLVEALKLVQSKI